MEFWKYLSNAKASIIAMLAVQLALSWLSILMPGQALIFYLSLDILQAAIINPALLTYAGYITVKKNNGSEDDAAVSGEAAGLVTGAVMLVLGGFGIKPDPFGVNLLSGVFCLFFFVAGGFAFGKLGAYLAKRRKKA